MVHNLQHIIRRASACAFALVALGCAHAATVSNNILTVEYNDIGQFSVRTGGEHPVPNSTVFYPVGTSYISIRDDLRKEVFVTDDTPVENYTASTDTYRRMGAGTQIALGTTGFRTTWTLPNFNVVQEVEITGTALSDTNVRHEVRVINTGATALKYGVRYLWDWQIAGNDASIARPRNPDGAYSSTFAAFPTPNFRAYEQTDDLLNPKFSIYGTVSGGSTALPPTLPDRVAYVEWNDFYGNPWDTAITGENADSAIVYYWGYATPRSLAPGASTEFRQYVSTVASSLGVSGSTTKTLTEYLYAPLNYYFLTSRDDDKAALNAAPGWSRTGSSFAALTDADPGTRGITRYYFDQVAKNKSRGSHFYTLVATEKSALNALNPGNLSKPQLPKDEGIDSYAYPPLVEGVGGTCAAGLRPVYRLFRGAARFPDDPNHRLTTSLTIYNQFVALGWDGEGVKMCVPN
jgi:hypothetical protein